MEPGVFLGIVKGPAVVDLDIAFRWRAFGENDLVLGEFEVEILEPLDHLCLGDGHAVDQELGWHQQSVNVQRVLGRDPKVARGNALIE
jgi:hypothetical protein